MKWKTKIDNIYDWHDFFCLFPEDIDGYTYWLCVIERKAEKNKLLPGTHWLYRAKK